MEKSFSFATQPVVAIASKFVPACAITSGLATRWPAANASVTKWAAKPLSIIASLETFLSRWAASSACLWIASHERLWSSGPMPGAKCVMLCAASSR